MSISEHNIEHQKINLDQKIRAIAKDEAKRIPTSRGGGGGGIEEAPKDNKQYARKDAKWSEVVIPPAEEERDPVWTAEKTNYYTKSQADALYQPKIVVSASPPTSPVQGDLWFNITTASLAIYYLGWNIIGSGTPPAVDIGKLQFIFGLGMPITKTI
jgi:hypothetical protein